MAKQIIWTTKMVNEASEKINNGFVLGRTENPFFDNTIGLRKGKLTFKLTKFEYDEYIKCKVDIHYFAEQYCWVKGERGEPVRLKLRDYQKDILDNFFNNRFNILMASRQTGKTISSAIMMLHFVLFNNNKNVLVTANKLDTAIEVLDKMREIYQRLPFFLQKGIINWNQKFMVFENKSRIKGFATTKTASIGQSADFLYLDEFAYLPNNIADKFYKSVFPTVSNIENSKIIITSTPNGMDNLFYRLLMDAEKPEGEKSSYKAFRVYWWQVPKKFVTYIRLNNKSLESLNTTHEEIYEKIREKFPKNETEMYYNSELKKWVINVFNTADCSEDDILKTDIILNDQEIKISHISEITTWKKETIKDIGGEEAFSQEFDLRFINSSRSLLDESLIEELNRNKETFIHMEIPELENKLKFSYKDLKWTPNEVKYNPQKRKEYKIKISIDISEGLGQDYSIINIFKLGIKPLDIINSQKNSYRHISNFIQLEQIGIFRSNIISVEQLAEILYLIVFEHFNPDNVKCVLEINNYGNELLAHLPNVFDGNNEYGSSILYRYKHRVDSIEEKIGLKIGENKNILVKEYQDKMQDRTIIVTEENTISEMITFIKHTTSAGNVRYAGDGSSHDDCVMTIVNLTSIFGKNDFRGLADEFIDSATSTNTELKIIVDSFLKKSEEFFEGVDYKQLLDIRKRHTSNNRRMIEARRGWGLD